jgi:dTDP-4-dehydrorhamnose reductase
MIFPGILNKNDKIMIIGAKGNLGGQLMRALGNEYRLVLLDREEVDIAEKESVENVVEFYKPDYIINAAAYNAVDKCEESESDFELAKKINQIGVRNLAEICLENKIILIHYSTDYVFGGVGIEELNKAKERGGFDESMIPKQGNRYAETKLAGEQEIMKLAGSGLKYYLIRTSKLFGPKGESAGAKPNFFDIMLDLSKTKDSIDAVDSETSCFTYTYDLAKATMEMIKNQNDFGIYHITNQDACTWYEAVKYLFELKGIKKKINAITPNDLPRPAKRPEYSELRSTKLKPMRSYREALREYLGEREC